jgi:16S rRNA (cytosine1402-N4)-methyltransferase
MTTLRHDSVLLEETIETLALTPHEVVVDATVGGAGHFMRIVEKLDSDGEIIGIDADAAALDRARAALASSSQTSLPKVHLVEDNFRNLSNILTTLHIPVVHKVLFDLGWSGFQLAGGKGFSFQNDEPLLMTYGPYEKGKSAADVVNTLPEQELANLIYEFGEEHNARRIARAIVDARRKERILSTKHLADVVATAVHARGRVNPATKTFQALRIAVNDGALREGLSAAFEKLAVGGRIAVISFHSTEDRMVKEYFRARVNAGEGASITKKAVAPSAHELRANRRSRSAKLRVIEKIPTQTVTVAAPSFEHSYV